MTAVLARSVVSFLLTPDILTFHLLWVHAVRLYVHMEKPSIIRVCHHSKVHALWQLSVQAAHLSVSMSLMLAPSLTSWCSLSAFCSSSTPLTHQSADGWDGIVITKHNASHCTNVHTQIIQQYWQYEKVTPWFNFFLSIILESSLSLMLGQYSLIQ